MRFRATALWLVPVLAAGLLAGGCADENKNGVPEVSGNAAANGVSAAGNAVGTAGNAIGNAAGAVGNAVGNAGHAAANAVAESGQTGANGVLTAKVKSALIGDKTVAASKINVNSQAGIVTLEGDVSSAAEKKQAEALAKKTQGVKSVVNKLTVNGK
jgi:hyperosmotically inducible protein